MIYTLRARRVKGGGMAVEKPDLEHAEGAAGDRVESGGFDRVRRGFAPDQVAEHLKRVAASVLTLESRLEEARTELLETRRERDAARAELGMLRPDPYDGVSDRVTELIRTFDQQVSDLQRDAQVEADQVLADVKVDADRIIVQAHDEAERIIGEARQEADRIRAGARSDERDAQIRAERIVAEAKVEANRAESDIGAMRSSTLETFRDIRRRTLEALGEVEAVIESGGMPGPVVIVEDSDELATNAPTPIPRPDL